MDLGGAELRHPGSASARSSSSTSPSAAAAAAAQSKEKETQSPQAKQQQDFKIKGWNFSSIYFGKNDRIYRKISIVLLCAVVLAATISLPPVWNRINPPYLCKKEGIVLHCPHVKDIPSLWENPYSATTSWKPCAERRNSFLSPPQENETNGYLLIHAEGGLNQQRISKTKVVNIIRSDGSDPRSRSHADVMIDTSIVVE